MAPKETKKEREREHLAAVLAARQRKKRRAGFAAIGAAAVAVS